MTWILCGSAAMVLSFIAGLNFRNRSQERANEVIDVVLTNQASRIERLENLLQLSTDLEEVGR
jgi:hypothetical protein